MTTRLLKPIFTVAIDGDDDAVRSADVTLDAGAVPYASATVVMSLMDDATLELLDPRAGDVRVPVTGGETGGTSRVFDLGLRSREVDHVAKTVTLTLAGDEALLRDYAPLADDDAPRALEASLRDVCDYVLSKIGAALEPGGDDADVTAYWTLTNLATNPSFETNANDTAVSVNASALSSQLLVSPPPVGGTRALRATAGAGTSAFYPAGYSTAAAGFKAIRVTPGKAYTASLYAVGSTARAARIGIVFRDEGGNPLAPTVLSDYANDSGMVRYHVTAVAPGSAATLAVIFETLANTAGQFHFVDGVMVTEGTELVPYFDGSIAPPGYTTAWDGTAQLSASTRTPDVERLPESLVWKAGQTGWDFLAPLCAQAGLVLWCDEQRRWFLQTPASRTVDMLLSVTATNTREGTDVLTRDDDVTYVTGIICRYRWTDAGGIAREQIDAAGTPGKVLVVTFENTVYPGPGVAAAMLTRRAGTGRSQDVTVFTRWAAAPGMTASLTLPGAPETEGRVAAVTFRDDGFMRLRMAGLIDIPPGSWIDGFDDLAWDDVPDATTWDSL